MTSITIPKFEDREVIVTKVAVTNAGDGLSQALGIEPSVLHVDDRVYVVLECDVTKVGFAKVKDTGTLQRVHTLRAGAATIVDKALVIDHLAAQAERIRAAKGEPPIPGLGIDAPDDIDEQIAKADEVAAKRAAKGEAPARRPRTRKPKA